MGPVLHHDRRSDRFVPDRSARGWNLEDTQNKKLMLVELDSRFDARKTLPNPGVVRYSCPEEEHENVPLLQRDLDEDYEVLAPEGPS